MALQPLPSPAAEALSMRRALLDSLYCDMLILADEVRAGLSPQDADCDVEPAMRVRIACEHLRLSARLMRMTQLLLDHRAGRPAPRLVIDTLSTPLDAAPLPAAVAAQLDAAGRLEARLAEVVAPPLARPSPVMALQDRLISEFG